MRPETPRWLAAGQWLPFIVVFLLAANLAAQSDKPAKDPVEVLSEILSARLSQKEEPTPESLAIYKKQVAQGVAGLSTVGELRRAVFLADWQGSRLDAKATRTIKKEAQAEVADRLRKELEAILRGRDAVGRQAAAQLAGDVAQQDRENSSGQGLIQPAMAKLAPALIDLANGKDTDVIVASSRALGKLEGAPETTVPVLRRLLAAPDGKIRQAAARALSDALRMPIPKFDQEMDRVFPRYSAQILQVVPAAGAGLASEDAEVRAITLSGLQELAKFLGEWWRDWGSDAEREKSMQTLLAAFAEQVPVLAKTLDDDNAKIAVKAAEVLEAFANIRLANQERARRQKPKEGQVKVDDVLQKPLRSVVPALADHLKPGKEIRLQLGCLYVLEALREDAVDAAPKVVPALKDQNAYVRWGAVRVLGRMAPLEADQAVPAMVPLLTDDNEYVRATALLALARYGPKVKPAVPALRKAATSKDSGMRILAIRALTAAGQEGAPAVPELGQALSAEELDVRRAALNALVRLGPPAKGAEDYLRKALNDSDADMRRDAAELLLSFR